MVLQNYQNFIEMTSNMIYIVAFGVGVKCPRKIHLNTQWEGGSLCQQHYYWSPRIFGPSYGPAAALATRALGSISHHTQSRLGPMGLQPP